MQIVIAIIVFALSSFYVLLLDRIAFTAYALLKVLALPIIVFLVLLYRSPASSWRDFIHSQEKWIFLFGGTVFIQILVLSTGGLYSPFLVLIHLFMIGVSFVFSFSLALFFLFFTLVVIVIDASFHQNVIAAINQDPITLLLQVVSLISIIPLAYIVSQQYHARDMLFSLLQKRVATSDAILKSLNEIIIVTDTNFRILSVNDAAEKIFQKSRSELLDSNLFEVLLLRNKNGKLVSKELFFPHGKPYIKPKNSMEEFTLIQSPFAKRTVTVQTQPISHGEDHMSEISFIISFVNFPSEQTILLDEARAKYEAMAQNIEKRLKAKNLVEEQLDLMLLQKIENDTFTLQTIETHTMKDTTARIDVAKLCEQGVLMDQDFAKALHVQVDFKLENFGEKDIASFAVGNFPVKVEHLTGPFFTVSCDVKQLELTIRKLLDLAIFLAATTEIPRVAVGIERVPDNEILITITANCPSLNKDDLSDIFTPYYGVLANKTNLRIASGLEGFLAKTLSNMLHLHLGIKYLEEKTPTIIFHLVIKKAHKTKQ